MTPIGILEKKQERVDYGLNFGSRCTQLTSTVTGKFQVNYFDILGRHISLYISVKIIYSR
jgi:hypothetical protein